jgi:hypothetical protein
MKHVPSSTCASSTAAENLVSYGRRRCVLPCVGDHPPPAHPLERIRRFARRIRRLAGGASRGFQCGVQSWIAWLYEPRLVVVSIDADAHGPPGTERAQRAGHRSSTGM